MESPSGGNGVPAPIQSMFVIANEDEVVTRMVANGSVHVMVSVLTVKVGVVGS